MATKEENWLFKMRGCHLIEGKNLDEDFSCLLDNIFSSEINILWHLNAIYMIVSLEIHSWDSLEGEFRDTVSSNRESRKESANQ